MIGALSLVIVVWLGTSMNCSRTSTFTGRSITGMRNRRPGSRTRASFVLPRRKTTIFSYCCTTRTERYRIDHRTIDDDRHDREQDDDVHGSSSSGCCDQGSPAGSGSTRTVSPSRPTTRTGVPAVERRIVGGRGPSTPRRRRRWSRPASADDGRSPETSRAARTRAGSASGGASRRVRMAIAVISSPNAAPVTATTMRSGRATRTSGVDGPAWLYSADAADDERDQAADVSRPWLGIARLEGEQDEPDRDQKEPGDVRRQVGEADERRGRSGRARRSRRRGSGSGARTGGRARRP